jgi:tol-pal system protein YbgF
LRNGGRRGADDATSRAARQKETSSDMTRTSFGAIALLGFLAVGLATWAGPRQAYAQSDEWNSLYDRIIRLEHEVRESRSGAGPISGYGAIAGDDGRRVAAIEDQLRQVLGVLDEIRRTQRVLEQRLERLEGAPRTTGSIFEPQQPPPYETPEQGFDFSQYQTRELAELSAEQDVTVQVYRETEPQRSLEPQVLGTLGATQAYQQGQLPGAGVSGGDGVSSGLLPETVERAALDGSPLPLTGDSTGDSMGVSSGVSSTGGSAERLYESAYESLLGRRFGAAEGSFKMFLDRHRDHPLVSDAHYWLGETYYVQGDYKQAAQSFLDGYRGYPEGRKAPDTLFKLALSLQQLEQRSQACSTFAEVAKKYPTAAAVRNEALKEMQRAGC